MCVLMIVSGMVRIEMLIMIYGFVLCLVRWWLVSSVVVMMLVMMYSV